MNLPARENLALWAAYGLLVLAVSWSTWNTHRALDIIEEDVCATAEVIVASSLLNLAVYGQQDDVNAEAAAFAIETLISSGQSINDRCGAIFLDMIELPDIEIPPLSLVPTTPPTTEP